MTRLGELADLIRSKNAGPFELTFDIMFLDRERYEQVKQTKVLSAELFAQLYDTPIERVLFVEHDGAQAFKATIPRPIRQGDLGETDIYGGQQFDPISQIEIPI